MQARWQVGSETMMVGGRERGDAETWLSDVDASVGSGLAARDRARQRGLVVDGGRERAASVAVGGRNWSGDRPTVREIVGLGGGQASCEVDVVVHAGSRCGRGWRRQKGGRASWSWCALLVNLTRPGPAPLELGNGRSDPNRSDSSSAERRGLGCKRPRNEMPVAEMESDAGDDSLWEQHSRQGVGEGESALEG